LVPRISAKKIYSPPVTSCTGGRLVKGFERMDVTVFQNRVLPVKNKLFRFALRMLGNEDEAKDVLQEVFIRLWNGREQLAGIQNMEAWSMRITKNLSLDRLRTLQRRGTYAIEKGVNVKHTDVTPDVKTELVESMENVSQLIAALPEKQRMIIHLRDVEGYSYNEICDILELDMNQVKVNLFRARNAVREKLMKINAYGL
jgi:RNA polymerase sigma-70 factor (ECF subfamily)